MNSVFPSEVARGPGFQKKMTLSSVTQAPSCALLSAHVLQYANNYLCLQLLLRPQNCGLQRREKQQRKT